jgi:uncharacterized protein (DUF305 family)
MNLSRPKGNRPLQTFTFKTTLIAACFFTIPTLASAQDMKGMDMGSSPADQANMQAMQKMQDAMPKQGTGNPDKDFVTMMIPILAPARLSVVRAELKLTNESAAAVHDRAAFRSMIPTTEGDQSP